MKDYQKEISVKLPSGLPSQTTTDKETIRLKDEEYLLRATRQTARNALHRTTNSKRNLRQDEKAKEFYEVRIKECKNIAADFE